MVSDSRGLLWVHGGRREIFEEGYVLSDRVGPLILYDPHCSRRASHISFCLTYRVKCLRVEALLVHAPKASLPLPVL